MSARARSRRGIEGASRRKASLVPVPQLIIVCEGRRTEKQYFEAFAVPSMQVEGIGEGPVGVVRRALELRRAHQRRGAMVPETWCVFDRDPGLHGVSVDQFMGAIQSAESHALRVAWSNECFRALVRAPLWAVGECPLACATLRAAQ